jgi:hypothetical protein
MEFSLLLLQLLRRLDSNSQRFRDVDYMPCNLVELGIIGFSLPILPSGLVSFRKCNLVI